MNDLHERAAHARRDKVAQRADRPTQRRSLEAPTSRGYVAAPAAIELRSSSTSTALTFEGHATVYERAYEMWDLYGPYTEVVTSGAGAESLARADLDVPFVLGHDQMRRMARTTTGTLQLTEDDAGLHVLAPDLDPADADVAYIAPKLRAGLIDEMSFAFRIEAGVWSPDYTEYRIQRYDIHRGDVAIVGWGANPATDAGLRTAPETPASRSSLVAVRLALALADENRA